MEDVELEVEKTESLFALFQTQELVGILLSRQWPKKMMMC
jgi:hypothetical protein